MRIFLLNPSDFTRFSYLRGRVGLAAILKCLGVDAGDDVVTQAFTCSAVPEAIMYVGARPIYVDIEADGVNMDPADLAKRITRRTKAIIVQHTYGIPADLELILEVSGQKRIPVVEDCAHTLASTYRGRILGSFGAASFYSYEWGKPVITGIGGSVRINDGRLEARMKADYSRFREPSTARQMRLFIQYLAHAVVYRPSFYWPIKDLYHALGRLGVGESNYTPPGAADRSRQEFATKMSALHQVFLRHKLRGLADLVDTSRSVAARYKSQLGGIPLQRPRQPDGADTIFSRYPLFAADKAGLLHEARRQRIELSDWYATPVHPISGPDLEKVCYRPGSCPRAESACKRIVTLPVHAKVRRPHVDKYVKLFGASGLT